MRLGAGVAFAQIGIVGFDGQIEVEALRFYGLPEAVQALPCGSSPLPVRQREFAVEVAWDLPNLAPGDASLLDVTVPGAQQGDIAHAALALSTRLIEIDASACWTRPCSRCRWRNGTCRDWNPDTLGATSGSGSRGRRLVPWSSPSGRLVHRCTNRDDVPNLMGAAGSFGAISSPSRFRER